MKYFINEEEIEYSVFLEALSTNNYDVDASIEDEEHLILKNENESINFVDEKEVNIDDDVLEDLNQKETTYFINNDEVEYYIFLEALNTNNYEVDTSKENEEHLILNQEKILNDLRIKRKPLLEAFDTYKSNVAYGIIEETEEEKLTIITWYHSLLNLEDEAFDNVPTNIQYYT